MDIIIRRSIVLILFLVFLFCTQNFVILSLGMNNNIICKQSERRALLSFKQHLRDPSDSLSSWSGENCCGWAGVVCSNTTDHVVQLHLQQLGMSGELNPSLQELKQLRHLDLSLNQFEGISIPDFLGSLQSLRYLDLSNANFSGMLPHQLGNLSNLRYLDLTASFFPYGSIQQQLTVVGNFQWISHLSSLQHLDLSRVNLENASSNWFHAVNMLPSLLVLRLSNCGLSGGALPTTTSLSHVNFTSLEVLDLHRNNINSTLPEWLYSLTNLEQLDLSFNSFQGTISPSIGNLTKLTLLDLSNNQLEGEIPIPWLYSLTNLEQLDLSFNSFQGTISPSIGNLTKLTLLDLSNNQLEGEIPITLGNLCNLQRLDLLSNKLNGEISGFLETSTGCIARSLEYLDLSHNQLSGPLPDQLGRLQNLDSLKLRNNSFSGSIPFSIGRLTSLRILYLGWNQLNGSVPENFGNLSKLEMLFLSYNTLEGIVSEVHFSNLTSLQFIELDSVELKVSPEWIPPFQLKRAVLRNCRLGPRFPNWLQTQKLLVDLIDLSSNGISGTVPTWFWNLSSQCVYLNLSHNHFNGELPKVLKALNGIDLSSNQFKGPLPRLASSVIELDLSNNLFSGPISSLVCNPFTEENIILVLDLSNNQLSGGLSECWFYWRSLQIVRLGSNNITGKIPNSMGSLFNLQSLHLQNNNLFGELPLSLRNCTSLKTLDIGENVLAGRLPIWLGESFPYLIVLRLRRNKFDGEIPQQLCDMTSLQMLDLAHNNLSGSIPRCFSNFSAMVTKQNSSRRISYTYSSVGGEYVETTSLVMKGQEFQYSNTLTLVTSMDLSKNSLSGEIPEELASLIGLRFLNLSENHFTGNIPEKIGNMVLLESLDFSNNNISGVIPQSISGLYFLGNLNLSYNNLSGKIPLGTQLQSFNESSYIGNEYLCGLPLKNCSSGEDPLQKPGAREAEDEEDWFEMKWFYMSMGVGFVVGFWAFCGVMVLKRSWRIAYFCFLDDMKNKIYVLF